MSSQAAIDQARQQSKHAEEKARQLASLSEKIASRPASREYGDKLKALSVLTEVVVCLDI